MSAEVGSADASKPAGCGSCLLYGLVLLLFLGAMLGAAVWYMLNNRAGRSDLTVKVPVVIEERVDQPNDRLFDTIKYSYTVDGKEYRDAASVDKEDIELGYIESVCVNPDNPEENALNMGACPPDDSDP